MFRCDRVGRGVSGTETVCVGVGGVSVQTTTGRMAAYGVYGNGNCGGDVYANGDDTDLYHQVVVLSKPDGSCIRSQANGSGVCGAGNVGAPVIVEMTNGRRNGEQSYPLQPQQHQQHQQQQQQPCNGVGGVQRRHRRSFWCRTTTLATISALLAAMFCITCAVFLYYNCEYTTRRLLFQYLSTRHQAINRQKISMFGVYKTAKTIRLS